MKLLAAAGASIVLTFAKPALPPGGLPTAGTRDFTPSAETADATGSAETAPASGSSSFASILSSVEFNERFGKFDACFVLKSLDDGWTLRYNEPRCVTRFSPCSTFKIPNALAGMDCGFLRGADHEMKWDGTSQNRKECERDHTLDTAIRDSVMWYFQRVAAGVGAERMQKYLDALQYGNRDMSGGLTKFWLQTSLEISADEQVRFLENLYTGKLPFDARAVETVKGLIVFKKGDGWTLSGKTGTGGKGGKSMEAILGWYVGHVHSGDRQYVFAVNASGDGAMGPKVRAITIEILRKVGLTPSTSQ
ncbi:MAG TPA: penicillin-binding transpeptidase domain-containing protein [Phycisphaerae bacterium]|nr:penicillin-binding transpeptidase domain-containing protein [Phycisphaerae bacterium]